MLALACEKQSWNVIWNKGFAAVYRSQKPLLKQNECNRGHDDKKANTCVQTEDTAFVLWQGNKEYTANPDCIYCWFEIWTYEQKGFLVEEPSIRAMLSRHTNFECWDNSCGQEFQNLLYLYKLFFLQKAIFANIVKYSKTFPLKLVIFGFYKIEFNWFVLQKKFFINIIG